MKYIYQVVEADFNNEVTYAGDYFASEEAAKERIEKQFFNAKNWEMHPWRMCRIGEGSRREVWDTYHIIKLAYDTKGCERRIGIITRKLY